MADNYLEKRYAEVFGAGSGVKARREVASLDTLLGRLAAAGEADASYVVKQAQLDAMVRSANKLAEAADCQMVADEATASIRICGCASELALGQLVLAMRLKAAELHLRCAIEGDILKVFK